MELNKIHNIDALSGLRALPDNSVDCIVTSPPYYQMRDYGIADVAWGDGWNGQLGQEPTRELFVAHLIEIFDECRRVLKDSGTLWVNLADSYKNKSLCNIPNYFADEMIKSGWYLRNEIIWHKPSCLPSGATDRFTNNYEKLYFFTKSKKYNFNQQFEPYAESTIKRYNYPMTGNGKNGVYKEISGAPCDKMMRHNPNGRNMRTVWKIPFEGSKEGHFAMFPSKLVETPILAGSPEGGKVLDPFMGGGTTAIVAKRTGRNFIGFELNPEYVDIALRRVG